MRRLGGLHVARTAALLALGGLAVHQLRYLLAFGGGSGAELHRQGHDYLAQALPIVIGLAMAAIVARLLAGAFTAAPTGARRAWLRGVAYTAALVGVFWAQELAEGALAAGHPEGLGAVLGGGAWVALPLALTLGLAAAGVERLLDRAAGAIAVALSVPARRLAPATRRPSPISLAHSPLAARALAFGFARRPPPPVAIT